MAQLPPQASPDETGGTRRLTVTRSNTKDIR